VRQPELCQAAGVGNLSLVQRLIDIGEVVSVKANDGSTPLHCASRAGHVDVLVLLLRSGCALTEKNDMKRTALQEAALGNHVEAVRTLINRGGDAESILHTVTKTGTKELIELMIECLGFEQIRLTRFPVREKGHLSPLHHAALHGNEPVLLALLLDPEADPDQQSTTRLAPLHYAALSGHDGVVKILLETKQVDINLLGRASRTPLHCAAMKGHERVVMRLLDCERIDINVKRYIRYHAPVQSAVASGNILILELFLRDDRFNRDCLEPSPYDFGESLLQTAAISGRLEIVEWLLSTPDIYRSPNTANEHLLLHYAVRERKTGMVKLLLERKDVDIETRASHNHRQWPNMTAIQVARESYYCSKDITNILLAHGAIEYPTKDLALPAAPETNETSAVLSSEFSEIWNESSQDLDMDKDMLLDFEMQDSYMDEFLTFDGEDPVPVDVSHVRWRPWETC
jgi:ankyrin repeat protein